MSLTQTQPIINNEKRSFIKTMLMSIAFIAFGGFGSFYNSSFLSKLNPNIKSGFGSNGYGK
jgi:hypothetical protein